MTFGYLTVSCTGHVYDISIPDSFMYTCYWSCAWHWYLTVSCRPGTGHVAIWHFDTCMYTWYRSCIWHFDTWQFHVYLVQVMYMTFWYLTVSCLMLESHWSLCYYYYYTCTSRTQNRSLFFIFHVVLNDETDLSGFCFNLSVQLFSYCISSSVIWLCSGIGS